jgi:hypothetical protein
MKAGHNTLEAQPGAFAALVGVPSEASSGDLRRAGTEHTEHPDTSAPLGGRLPWPLPALLGWALAWGVFGGLRATGFDTWPCLLAGLAAGAALALAQPVRWRRLIVAGGFPVSALLSGLAAAGSGWAWLLPLLLLLLAYPRHAWRDAPFFPTPAGALDALATVAPLPEGAQVLDAGCGLGHGLRALRRAYPQADISGIEWSPLLSWAARLRCPWATVRRGDLWAQSWSGRQLVYLFQRPESMPRAVAKARQQLAPGAWLVSLEFEAPGLQPHAVQQGAGGRCLWIYRMPPSSSGPPRR